MHTKRTWFSGPFAALLLCVAVLSGCVPRPSADTATTAAPYPQEEKLPYEQYQENELKEQSRFSQLEEQLFREQVCGCQLDLQYLLRHPENFGISSAENLFAPISMDAMEENRQTRQQLKEELDSFSPALLSEKQKVTFHILQSLLKTEALSEGLELYYQPLSATIGIQAELPILLCEYSFYEKQDVEEYLALLDAIDDYYKEILAFEQQKSDAGLMMSDTCIDHVIESCESYLLVPGNNFLIDSFNQRLELEQTDGQCYLVFDQAVRESLAAIESYIKKGIVAEADTPEALGEEIGVDGAALAETLKAYAGYQAAGKDDEFGRESMELPLDQPKYYAALCAPAIHHTMGGVKINTACEVLKADGSAIPGLFAAGEVTGGVHGANRLGGNAVTDIVVFGRIAGTGAEAYVEANGGHTEAEITADGGEAAAAPEVQGSYKDGVYEGTGKGNNGDITVEVTVEGGNIVSVTLKEHGETEGIYEAAEKSVVADIIKTQSAEVDAVSGATNTSNGIMEAVTNALAEAK